jgi:excisionase family DNA binding protein
MENQPDTTMSVNEVAAIMGITHRGVLMLISRGRLPSVKLTLGRMSEHRIKSEDVIAFKKLKRGWPKGQKRPKNVKSDSVADLEGQPCEN